MKILIRKFLVDRRLRKQVKQRFYYRDLLEVIRKKEEFKFKLLEAEKNPTESNGGIKKYQNYLVLLNWIINCKNDTAGNI